MDFHDFAGIIILLIVNSTISFIEENNAGNAAQALMARLAPKAKVTLIFIYQLLFLSAPNVSFVIFLSIMLVVNKIRTGFTRWKME